MVMSDDEDSVPSYHQGDESSIDHSSSDDDHETGKTSARRRRMLIAMSIMVFRQRMKKKKRGRTKRRVEKSVEALLDEARKDGHFKREYRMSSQSFDTLCHLLKPHLENVRDTRRGFRRKDTIPLKLVVATTLGYFAGASYLDLMRRAGISNATVFKCRNSVRQDCQRSWWFRYTR